MLENVCPINFKKQKQKNNNKNKEIHVEIYKTMKYIRN